MVFTALPPGLVAELALGTVRPLADGIGRMLQMLLVGPMLLLALFGAAISTPLRLHWLLTRIDTTLDNWIFWALLVTVAINGHVLYAHLGLWGQLRG